MRRLLFPVSLAALLVPMAASASTTTDLISQIAGLFYIIVGLTVVAAFLTMATGIVMWIVRLGTDHTFRDKAIKVMEWAVATLFTLILVLGVVEFVQDHTSTTLYILSIVVILLVIWLFATSGIFSGGEKEEDE